jgi:UDP-N-acetylmuramyl tripeptide synthase
MKTIAILICKIAKKLAQKLGRGSSFPGKVALKLCPDILSRVSLPENIIAVTGSNGKTSTVEMIYHLLCNAGLNVACNLEGSNQIEGVTTLILDNCDLEGRFKKDVLLIEVDERYAKYVFSYITPKFYLINNLYRDQMTRNGHPEYVMDQIRKSIRPGSTLILNSDDPLIASLASLNDNAVVFYGAEENEYVSEKCESIYNDGYYCPLCKHKMIYDYYQFAHVGKYECTSCGFERSDPDYAITEIDLEQGYMIINDVYRIELGFKSIINSYNSLAAFTLGKCMKIKESVIVDSLNSYLIKNGRIQEFKYQDIKGTLLISKHENTISYNQNLQYITTYDGEVELLLIIDDISRKYFTSDTSWLWDISFELLNSDNVRRVIVAGKYINDVAVRFINGDIDMSKVILKDNVSEALVELSKDHKGTLFAMTCFSDQDKLLKEVDVL